MKKYFGNIISYFNGKKKSSLKKKLLFVSICIMLLFVSLRSYSLYLYYNSTLEQDVKLESSISDLNNNILKEFLLSSYRNSYYHNQSAANNLQTTLINIHGKNAVYDYLVNGNYNEEIYKTFMNVFNDIYQTDSNTKDAIVIVANDEGIVFLESNNNTTKFKKRYTAKNGLITWDEFIAESDSPNVLAKAFKDAHNKSYTDHPVIIRLDEQFNGETYYTLEDLYEIYEEEGIEGLEGYGFLTCSVITDTGDIYGNIDNPLNEDNEVHKLYVYHYMDVTTYLRDHEQALDKVDRTTLNIMDTMQMERKLNILISCCIIIILVIVIILLLMVYKEIDDSDRIVLLEHKLDENNKKD